MKHKNNFHIARLLAATMVVYGHSFDLLGKGGSVIWYDTGIAAYAVRIFFVISGYLICKSWNSDPHILRYLERRCLRILPALAVVIILTITLLGPSVTTLSIGDYADSLQTRQYLWNILLAPRFNLPGVFAHTPFPVAVNGSLWTLPAEFLMYLLLPLYGSRHIALCRTVIFPPVLIAAVALAFYFTWVTPESMRPVIYWSSLPQITRWAPYFIGGAAFAFWRFERHLRLDVALILIGLISCLRPLGMPVEGVAAMLLTPYIVLAFCMTRDGVHPLLDWDADFSYGTYLYAFPIQQTVILLTGNKITPLVLFAICLPIVYCAALLSWFLIERPALSQKPWRRVAEESPTVS